MKLFVAFGALLITSCGASLPDDVGHDVDAEPVDAQPESSNSDGESRDTASAFDAIAESANADDASADATREARADASVDRAADVTSDGTGALESSSDSPTDASADKPVLADVGLDGPSVRDGGTDVSILDDGRTEASASDGDRADTSACPAPPFEDCPWGPDAGDAIAPDGAIPSFARDVFPIIQSRCSTCHAVGNDAGLWTFDDYHHVWDWQRLINADLIHCTMPPADKGSLSLEERATVFTWLYCGTPDN